VKWCGFLNRYFFGVENCLNILCFSLNPARYLSLDSLASDFSFFDRFKEEKIKRIFEFLDFFGAINFSCDPRSHDIEVDRFVDFEKDIEKMVFNRVADNFTLYVNKGGKVFTSLTNLDDQEKDEMKVYIYVNFFHFLTFCFCILLTGMPIGNFCSIFKVYFLRSCVYLSFDVVLGLLQKFTL
jgi:hypothetical protein